MCNADRAPTLRDCARDPATFAGVALTLAAVAIVAAALPAWRATRIDPNVALRAD